MFIHNTEELESWHHCWLLGLHCTRKRVLSVSSHKIPSARGDSQTLKLTHTLMRYTSTFGCVATYSHPSLGPVSAALGFQQGDMLWDRGAPRRVEKPELLSENTRQETSLSCFSTATNMGHA